MTRKTKHGIRFPEGLDPPDDWAWYRIDYGETEVWDMGWEGHVDLLHEAGLQGIDTEMVDSGVDRDGIRYASVVATVHMEDGSYSSISGADETSQQVRDPEYVWSVAESRAIKRAAKKALNLAPVGSRTEEANQSGHSGGSGGSVDVSEDGDVEVNPPPEFEPDEAEDVGDGEEVAW